MLPIALANNGPGIFNIEIPYYNWYYPITHSDEMSLRDVDTHEVPLDFVRAAYVHFPFCTSLCSFCPYIRTANHDVDLRDAYVGQLVREILSYQHSSRSPLDCIFFGGGTPSMFSGAQFERVMDALSTVFDIPSGCEITMEVGASTFRDPACEVFRRCGVTNVRVGVQSFNPQARRLFGLTASVDDIVASAALARKHGFGLSFDLLYGYHGQTLEHFLADIAAADELQPDTIEIYAMNLLTAPDRFWKAVENSEVSHLSARQRVEYSAAGRALFKALGYYQWSGHGFARSRAYDLLYHRCVYGSRGGYVGFGPGAASLGRDFLKINHFSIERYMDEGRSNPHYCVFPVSDQQHTIKQYVSELPYYGHCKPSCAPGGEVGARLDELITAGVIVRSGVSYELSECAKSQYASVMYYLLPDRDRQVLGAEMFGRLAELSEKFSADMLWL